MNTNTCIANSNTAIRTNLNATLSVNENKENKTMNTMNFVTKIARRTVALLVFAGLLAFSHQNAAQADIEITDFHGSNETVAPAHAPTAMSFLVHNTDNHAVSGLKVEVPLASINDFVIPISSAFSLNAHQSKWITVGVPAKGDFGKALLNEKLTGFAYIVDGGDPIAYDVSFSNVAPASDIKIGNPTVTSTANGEKTFHILFSNDGYAASKAEIVTVTTWLYADGQVGPALTHKATLTILQVGHSQYLSFTTQPTQGYDVRGSIQIGKGKTVDFSL